MSQTLATIPTEQSPKLKTALAWLKAVRESDLDGIAATLDDKYEHFFHPASIGKDTHSKQEWIDHTRPMLDMFRNVEIELYDIVESSEKVVFDFKYLSKYHTKSEFDHEVVVILSFAGEPNKPTIRLMKEFSDSASYAGYLPKLEAHKASQQ